MTSRGITYHARLLGLLIFAVLLGLLTGCGSDVVTDQNKAIPNEPWGMEDTLGFPFTIEDTAQAYDLFISLRHTTDYSYRNLFLFVDTHFPGGSVSRDTLEFLLAHPDGKWLGKGFSKIKYMRFMVRKGVTFPESGDYRFVLRHAMRVETLPELRDLGVRIVRTESARKRL